MKGGPLELEAIRAVVRSVLCEGYTFEVTEGEGALYLQASYSERDIVTGEFARQYTRKWRLSQHMVKSEVVQTCLKCVLTSAEHRVREHFLYCGERVYGPHFDVDALWEIANKRRLDYRQGK